MITSDIFNVTLLESKETVDQINKKFYGRYNYPWPPLFFQGYPENFARSMLSQDVGHWSHDRLPSRPKIWVAGCGTNQAVFTALRFPDAEVVGTDISAQSIGVGKRNAASMGLSNLRLEERSLNETEYQEEFDYIICTGVVHHNAQPAYTLGKIARALKPEGILEFMVYNYYHRLLSTACQKAIRNFYDVGDGFNLEKELEIVKHLIKDIQPGSLMGDYLRSHADVHEAEMTDSLIQPLEYSYTIESLQALAESCGLDILLHCQNQFDIKNDAFTWNMKFDSDFMHENYYSLSDTRRWQIANLLMCNDSPMLWFYFQRKDSAFPRKAERTVCEEFLETGFRQNAILLDQYVLTSEGGYSKRETPVRYPGKSAIVDADAAKIFEKARPDLKMRAIFNDLGIPTDFYTVNRIRIKLCTSGYPYLMSEPGSNSREFSA